MFKSKKILITTVTLGFVCMLALLGAAFSDHRNDKQPLRELEEKVHEDLVLAQNNESLANANALLAQQAAQTLSASLPLGPNTPAPIKVRGGSMTAFTKDQWKDMGGKASFCSLITSPDVISLDGNAITGVSLPWQIQIYGTSPDDHMDVDGNHLHDQKSPRGIQLTLKHEDCLKMPGAYSVTLQTFGLGGAGFYPFDLYTDPAGNKKANKRFMDSSTECIGDPKPSTPHIPDGQGDREKCERMREVDICNGGLCDGHTPVIVKPCKDGDCDLLIGN